MMVGCHGAFGVLISATVGTLLLVLAHGSAQNPFQVICPFDDEVPSCLEALVLAAEKADDNAQ
jgi:hypothetical protein